MSEAGGPRDKAQVLKAAPQLAGAAAQKPQRALQDKPRHGGGRAR